MSEINHYIDGATTALSSTRRSDVYNPATGQVTGQVALADGADIDAAIASSKKAFETWGQMSVSRRTNIMFRYRELLDANRLELAEMIASEHGKVRADALGEVGRGIEVVEFACGVGELLSAPHSEDVSTAVDSYTVRQALGVVAGITPFNFPAMVPMWMYPVAIACGNTFILKPSEKDPTVSIRMAELFTEAGLPEGVFNVLQGDAVAVNGLLDHPDVKGVSFVGSTPIAKYIHHTASANGKRVQALGGAKNHMMVLPDADMGQAADAAVSAGYGSAGERCMAISVIVAVGDVADRLVPEITSRIDELKIGPGLSDEDMDMGALITRDHRDRVSGYIDMGVSEGATLFDNVTTDMKIYEDEIFGPVLCLIRTETYDEALELINSSPFGNGTAIFTNDGGAARHFRRHVEAGMVGVNVPIPVPMAYHSFGGWKDSLFGDTHVHGSEGVKFYTRNKVITERWPDPHERGVNLGFPTMD